MLKLLLEAGAQADVQDVTGASPLHRAAAVNQVACVKLLVAAGASLELKTKVGETPLLSAAASSAEQAVVALVAAGADASATDADGRTVRSLLPKLSGVLSSLAAGEDIEI